MGSRSARPIQPSFILGGGLVERRNRTLDRTQLCSTRHQRSAVRPVADGRCRRVPPTCAWIESSAKQQVEAPVALVYEQYANLSNIPTWAKWIRSVEWVDRERGLTRWTVAAQGLSFSWKAKNVRVEPREVMEWRSIDGLNNRGEVRFESLGEHASSIELRVAFEAPGVIGRAFSSSYVQNFMKRAISSCLHNFRRDVLLEQRNRRAKTGS